MPLLTTRCPDCGRKGGIIFHQYKRCSFCMDNTEFTTVKPIKEFKRPQLMEDESNE